MIINEIQLTNIGAYKGNNSFNFQPSPDQNVILIGGENGAGKTTLLNSIKLGLFGSYGFGFKTENEKYYKRVEALLNHSAKKNWSNTFKIRISFSLVDNFENVNYVLTRYWRINNKSLKESYDLSANGRHLNDYEKELFQSKLKEVMPPQLLDLCLFDGEEIARIVNEDLLSDYIRNLSRVVFNLDLFESLEDDLEVYSSQALDMKKIEASEKQLYDLNLKEKQLRHDIAGILPTIKNLTEQKNELEDDYQRLKLDFEKYGGLAKSEREDLLKEIHKIEVERKQNNERLREFVSSLLPFYLSKDLLSQTRQQIHDEEALQLFNQLETRLTEDKLSTILKAVNINTNHGISNQLRQELLSTVKPSNDITQIHGASFSESSLVENMYIKTQEPHHIHYLYLINENKDKLTQLSSLKDKLKVNDSTNEFSEMIKQMELSQNKISILGNELETHQVQLNNWKNELNNVLEDIEKVQKLLRDRDKTESSFLESQKIIALSRRFREIQLKKKLQQVQIEASSMLKKIFRKHNYVASIIIDPETYDVLLTDSHKEHIEKSTLSAGEKEILLISIIWAIFKCSGRKVPFIFDTLLGRLDKTHKAAVLKEFIPNCGKQAIILSTDTEIDEYHYAILEHSISKEYMLEFDVENKATNIINQYFPFKLMGAN